MKLNIDLGQGGGETPVTTTLKDSPRKYYPSFTYSGDEEMDLPEEGEMVVEFKKVRSVKAKLEDGKERYECTIEIRKIVSVESEENDEPDAPATNRSKEAGSALDALMEAHMKFKKAY